jgi:hypothetical protein
MRKYIAARMSGRKRYDRIELPDPPSALAKRAPVNEVAKVEGITASDPTGV